MHEPGGQKGAVPKNELQIQYHSVPETTETMDLQHLDGLDHPSVMQR